MERFDVEVEILDSLSGIDVGSLSQPADEFGERVSELRLAWVAAAEWTTINLLRPRPPAHVAGGAEPRRGGRRRGRRTGQRLEHRSKRFVVGGRGVDRRGRDRRRCGQAVDALALSALPSRPSEASPAATSGTLLAKEEPTPLAAPDPTADQAGTRRGEVRAAAD